MEFTMTPLQVGGVQMMWRFKDGAWKVEFAKKFYQNLFRRAPGLEGRFHDPDAQADKLVHALDFVIGGLKRPETIIPIIQSLGALPAHRNASREEYVLVGEVLLQTLKEELGELFTPPRERAWETFYRWVASTMMEGAEAARSVATP
jgi:hemoglobin-like flavoprotein